MSHCADSRLCLDLHKELDCWQHMSRQRQSAAIAGDGTDPTAGGCLIMTIQNDGLTNDNHDQKILAKFEYHILVQAGYTYQWSQQSMMHCWSEHERCQLHWYWLCRSESWDSGCCCCGWPMALINRIIIRIKTKYRRQSSNSIPMMVLMSNSAV